MRNSTKTVVRILISILYIIWGASSTLAAVQALISFNLVGVLSMLVGLLMLFAGVLGLFKIKPAVCRLLGAAIFIMAAITFVLSIFTGISWGNLVSAFLAWLFITCI